MNSYFFNYKVLQFHYLSRKKCLVSLENCFHLIRALNVNKSGEIDNFFPVSAFYWHMRRPIVPQYRSSLSSLVTESPVFI